MEVGSAGGLGSWRPDMGTKTRVPRSSRERMGGAGSASGRGAEGTRWREGETDGPSCRGRAARGGPDEADPQPRRSVEEEGFERRGTDWLAASARVGAQGQNAGCLEGLALLPEQFLHLVCGVDGVTSGLCRLSLATGNPQQLEEPPPRLPPTRLPSLYPRLPSSPPEGAPSLPLRDRALVEPPSTAQRLLRPAPSTAAPEAGPRPGARSFGAWSSLGLCPQHRRQPAPYVPFPSPPLPGGQLPAPQPLAQAPLWPILQDAGWDSWARMLGSLSSEQPSVSLGWSGRLGVCDAKRPASSRPVRVPSVGSSVSLPLAGAGNTARMCMAVGLPRGWEALVQAPQGRPAFTPGGGKGCTQERLGRLSPFPPPSCQAEAPWLWGRWDHPQHPRPALAEGSPSRMGTSCCPAGGGC